MKAVCSDVAVSRGFLTASLRRKWGLDTVIPEVRIEEKLPIFDRENELITREDFERHRAYWEERGGTEDSSKTSRKIEKRIDHRHHLIDALVIGLTSRSLYQKMARAHKMDAEKADFSTKRRSIPLRAEPPIRNIRKLALGLVRNCNLTHKCDRWLGGPFFTKLPLAVVEIDGQDWFVQKKTLTEIATGKVETVRNRINRIVSQSTREAVLKAFDERIELGKNPKEALSEPILDPHFSKPIRRVKMRVWERADGAISVKHMGKIQNKIFAKYLKTDGYAYLELDKRQGNASLVTLYELIKSGERKLSQDFCRFFKGDTVLDKSDNKLYIVRQIRANDKGTLAMTLITESQIFAEIQKMDMSINKKGDYVGRSRIVSGEELLKLQPIPDGWPPHSSD